MGSTSEKLVLVSAPDSILGSAVCKAIESEAKSAKAIPLREDAWKLGSRAETFRLFTELEADAIVHLDFSERPDRSLSFVDTVRRDLNIAEGAALTGTHVVTVSSVHFYPLKADAPLHEDDYGAGDADPTFAPDAERRRIFIRALGSLERERGLSSTCLMLDDLYGPEDGILGFPGLLSAVHGWIMQAKASGDARIELPIDPDASVSALHVADAARAIVFACQSLPRGTFNVPGPEPVRMGELAHLLADASGYEGALVFSREGTVTGRALDGTRSHKSLGWNPVIGIEQGVRKTFGTPAEAK